MSQSSTNDADSSTFSHVVRERSRRRAPSGRCRATTRAPPSCRPRRARCAPGRPTSPSPPRRAGASRATPAFTRRRCTELTIRRAARDSPDTTTPIRVSESGGGDATARAANRFTVSAATTIAASPRPPTAKTFRTSAVCNAAFPAGSSVAGARRSGAENEAAERRSAGPGAGDLAGRRVQAVPEVDRRDREAQRGERRLVVVLGGLVPDVVGHGVGPVAQPGRGLGERERGALGDR